jgi:hypothetical protein
MKRFSVAFVLALGCVTIASPLKAQMHTPTAMTASEFYSAQKGAQAKIAVRVTALSRTSLRGELLEPERESVYAATGRRVELYVARDVPVVMGTRDDVRPGAVLFVYAVVTGPGRADAKKLFSITRVVTVEPRKT